MSIGACQRSTKFHEHCLGFFLLKKKYTFSYNFLVATSYGQSVSRSVGRSECFIEQPTVRPANRPTERAIWLLSHMNSPDIRPIPVADGWAEAEMRVFALSHLGPTDRPTDKASYRVACPQLKTRPDTRLPKSRAGGKGSNLKLIKAFGQEQ